MPIRKSSPRSPPSSDCPLEDCLALLASAWTPKILWFLREGPRRFGDLRRDLAGVSPKVLTVRLRELETAGLVLRTVRPTAPPTVEYTLTKDAEAFSPVLDAMAEFGRALKKKTRSVGQR
jgi:DNA-binding HxlR family transcriptional regulator